MLEGILVAWLRAGLAFGGLERFLRRNFVSFLVSGVFFKPGRLVLRWRDSSVVALPQNDMYLVG